MDKKTKIEKEKLIQMWFNSLIDEHGKITKDDFRTYNGLFNKNKAAFGLDLFNGGFKRDESEKYWFREEGEEE